jgi:hypothetical protein
MRYLCLIYQDELVALNRPRPEAEQIHSEYLAFTEEIKKSGRLLGNHGLQPTRTATTVRVRDGKVSTTDGPFAETKEQLGGYPSARFGSIEVRPVWL